MDRVSEEGNKRLLWGCLIFIGAAEITLVKLGLAWGLFLHIIILFLLFFYAAVNQKKDTDKIYLALSLVPLLRIINLSLPVVNMPPVYWYLLVGIPGWFAVFLFIKILSLSPGELGLKVAGQVPLQIIVGILLGILLGFFGYLALEPKPLIPKLETLPLIIAISIISLFVALLEETIFRGILFKVALEKEGQGFAYIFTCLAYCSLHIFYLSLDYLFIAFIAGVCFCWLVMYFNSLLAASLGHLTASITVFLIWPFYSPNFIPYLESINNEVKAKMIALINPLAQNIYRVIISEWTNTAPLVVIFLIVLLFLKELAATAAEYSTSAQLYWAEPFEKQINIVLIPLLYVFVLNILSEIMD